MTEAQELFCNLTKSDLNLFVELGNDSKKAMKHGGSIKFQLELGRTMEAKGVLFVPRLKKNLLSVSIIEDICYVVMFKNGQVLTRPKESNPNTTMAIEIRESNL